ncbi:MAG: hypothetical protein ACYDB5_10775 [bacterium]
MSKKDCHVYIDEKFIRKFGIENKSQIVNDALKKYYTEERENFNNDLQVIKDFTKTIDDLNSRIYNQQIEIQKLKNRVDLVFDMTTFTAYSTDIIREENDKKIITENIEELKEKYSIEKLKDKNKEEKS